MSRAELYSLLPLLILILGATGLLLVGTWVRGGRRLLLGAAVVALVAALCAGGLPPAVAEVGSLFSSGAYARFFTILWSLTAALTLLLSVHYGGQRGFPGGEYGALVLFAAAGMALLSAAASLLGFFLGLESLTLALYILIAFNKASAEGAEAGLKYLVLGATATGLLAFGIALIYLGSGTFHLPQTLAGLGAPGPMRGVLLCGWALLLVATAFKMSLAPMHLWTPDVYQGAPAPVTGLLAAGSKGAVAAALLTLSATLPPRWGSTLPLLMSLTVLTLLVGAIGGLRQDNLKRMLAYSSVAHMGYLLLALVAGGASGGQAAVFYLVAYTAATLGTFGVIASLSRPEGEPQLYAELRGLGYRRPWRASALTLFLLSLAGVPATAGFIAKFQVLLAALRAELWGLALVGVVAALLSSYYYLRLVMLMYMRGEADARLGRGDGHQMAVLAVCFSAVLLLGLFPGPLLDLIATVLP